MRECLKLGWLMIAGAAVALAGNAVRPPTRTASVVRADSKTGKLVRTVVVQQRVVVPRVVAPVIPATPPARTAAGSSAPAAIAAVIEETARKYDVDPLLVYSLVQVESAYNPYAVSPKGAQGLMQLIPGTARRFGVTNVWDVRQNIEGGIRYLRYLNSLFPNDLRLTLAAYNAGEAAVWKYGNSIPPYRETEQYVFRVGQRYGRARRFADRNVDQKNVAATTAKPAAPLAAIESYAPIEHYVDSEGRLHIRTRHSETP
ncbi:MAG TPA: lytic transglycosylase domain-containing protein [Bryobacteraceae bacterium]|nr:lytic transglycosylase domain-containing protein [Bryobacteraceae bacterium]